MQSITLPQLADGAKTATVVRWLKNPGDVFSTGDGLVELEIEEALVHLEASQSGRLAKVLAQPRATVHVGAELAQVEVAGAPATPAEPEKAATQQASDAAKPARESAPGEGTPGNVMPILMPQAGNTMEEGMLVSWKVAEGDHIEVGQIICEIETDKATIEHESPDAGRLARILAHEDETVPVKEPIALLADNDADVEAYLAARGTTAGAAAAPSAGATAGVSAAAAPVMAEARVSTGPSPVTAEGRVKASPAARKIARERGLDLALVGRGSGPGGRILSADVERAKIAAVASADGKPIRRPMPKMRRAIALNLQRSKQTIPHFYLRMTVNADPLFAYYRQQKPSTNCTLNDCVVLAVGRAMAEFPAVRSQIDGDEIIEYPHANVGIAVGVEHGLVVPVVRNVETLTLAQLAAEAKRVVENARNGKLENIGQGNFTITNLGMFGIEEFSAIINPPESGILAVGAVREAVIVENGTIRPGRVMTATLSADHRIVDGLIGAKFLGRLKEILENPTEALV
jgi:pyruvate dehydrogenase E2 component (dihydrolipoamide acetyltransferase)